MDLFQPIDALRDAITESYLSEPGNPYMQSGRSSGAQRWEESRKCISATVHRDGSLLDVGCANGLLLESLQRWLPPRQYDFVRTSLDCVPERMWQEWVSRQWDRLVAPGGRMILCWYYSSSEAGQPQPSPGSVLEALGLVVAGTTAALGTEVAWADKPE